MSETSDLPSEERAAVEADWFRYQAEVRSASEPFEKRVIEYHKAAVEFSKLLVTNLFVLNAGGLVSLPALSAFLGIKDLPPPARSYVLGIASAGFVSGLLTAALCSLFTYRNYHAHMGLADTERNSAIYNVGIVLRKVGFDKANRERVVQNFKDETSKWSSAIMRTYRLAHIFGWLSIVAFIGSGAWLGTQLR